MCDGVTDEGMLAIAAACPALECLELTWMEGVTEMSIMAIVEGCVHLTDIWLRNLALTNDTLRAKPQAGVAQSHFSPQHPLLSLIHI